MIEISVGTPDDFGSSMRESKENLGESCSAYIQHRLLTHTKKLEDVFLYAEIYDKL